MLVTRCRAFAEVKSSGVGLRPRLSVKLVIVVVPVLSSPPMRTNSFSPAAMSRAVVSVKVCVPPDDTMVGEATMGFGNSTIVFGSNRGAGDTAGTRGRRTAGAAGAKMVTGMAGLVQALQHSPLHGHRVGRAQRPPRGGDSEALGNRLVERR